MNKKIFNILKSNQINPQKATIRQLLECKGIGAKSIIYLKGNQALQEWKERQKTVRCPIFSELREGIERAQFYV